MMALGPYLAGARSYRTPPPDGVQEGVKILYGTGHYSLYLTLARAGVLPFLAMLLLAMWLWARRVARSDAEALLALLLLASVPPLLGHAALAALDVPAVATTLLALYSLLAWLSSGRWRDAVLFGITAGVAVGTKFSAIPFIGLGLIVLACARLAITTDARQAGVAHTPLAPLRYRDKLAGLALVIVGAAIPIVLAYGIHSADPALVTRRFNWAISYLLHGSGWLYSAANAFTTHVWLPRALKLLVEGVAALKAHNDTGHLSFLLGHLQAHGWWYFYLVGLAVKTPLTLLVSGLVGFGLQVRDGCRERSLWRLAPPLLFVTLLLFASTFSHINIGIRHVLILYPFLAMGAAYALAAAWRALGQVRSGARVAGRAVVVALVVWQVGTLWTAYPDYLPYFNETVTHPQRVLVDSDLDWGQDLRRLERRLAELKVPSLSLAYQGTADLTRESLPPFTRLAPNHPTHGWVAITALTRMHYPRGYTWLNDYTPRERIGKTTDLYYIPESAVVPGVGPPLNAPGAGG
jgi:4-amino-4-deoxy-L-arabinose transferase-like glycosyltransferase